MKKSMWSLSLVVFGLGVGCNPWPESKSKGADECKTIALPMEKRSQYDLNLDKVNRSVAITNCADLQKYYADAISGYEQCQSNSRKRFRVEAQSSSQNKSQSDSAATMSGSSNILGNQRVAGIDEADFTKVSDHHIFVVSGNQVVVLDRKIKSYLGKIELNGKDLAFGLSSMEPSQVSKPKTELLTLEDKLFVLSEKTIAVYHLKEGLLPEFKEKIDLNGQISTARLSGRRLLLVSYLEVPLASSTKDSDWMRGIDCSQVYIAREPSHNLMTVVSAHDVDNLGAKEEFIFASKLELYLTQNYVTLYENTGGNTDIRRIKIEDDGTLGRVKSVFVEGAVKDVWALSELGEEGAYLSVATSAWTNQIVTPSTVGSQPRENRGGMLTNHLNVLSDLNGDLRAVGAVKNFGLGEDIRSARKVGDLIYIVTFKKTDPLFAIDVSNPEDPKILSELKIPGFSTYMHPLSGTKLVGLGFDAEDMGSYALYQGIQVSLFDTSESRDVKRSDVKILGSRGSSSLATVDHRAFLMDQEASLFGFPLTEIGSNFSRSFEKQASDFFTGAIIYRVSGNALVEAKRISHRAFISPDSLMNLGSLYSWWQTPAKNQDIERLFKVDGNLVSVSTSGLKSFDYTRLEELTSVRWDQGTVSQSLSCGNE